MWRCTHLSRAVVDQHGHPIESPGGVLVPDPGQGEFLGPALTQRLQADDLRPLGRHRRDGGSARRLGTTTTAWGARQARLVDGSVSPGFVLGDIW